MVEVSPRHILIDLASQKLTLFSGDTAGHEYLVSTAYNGPGEQLGSGCTPRGLHVIRAKIGHHAVPNTVFVGRRPTGEFFGDELQARHPGRDWILTRILWLS